MVGALGRRSATRTPADRPGGADHHSPIRCMILRRQGRPPELDTLLSVEQAAERLGAAPVRARLVFQRRIACVKLGRRPDRRP